MCHLLFCILFIMSKHMPQQNRKIGAMSVRRWYPTTLSDHRWVGTQSVRPRYDENLVIVPTSDSNFYPTVFLRRPAEVVTTIVRSFTGNVPMLLCLRSDYIRTVFRLLSDGILPVFRRYSVGLHTLPFLVPNPIPFTSKNAT